eukprot:PhM_4_TR7175/c0_g2_i1/m.27745
MRKHALHTSVRRVPKPHLAHSARQDARNRRVVAHGDDTVVVRQRGVVALVVAVDEERLAIVPQQLIRVVVVEEPGHAVLWLARGRGVRRVGHLPQAHALHAPERPRIPNLDETELVARYDLRRGADAVDTNKLPSVRCGGVTESRRLQSRHVTHPGVDVPVFAHAHNIAVELAVRHVRDTTDVPPDHRRRARRNVVHFDCFVHGARDDLLLVPDEDEVAHNVVVDLVRFNGERRPRHTQVVAVDAEACASVLRHDEFLASAESSRIAYVVVGIERGHNAVRVEVGLAGDAAQQRRQLPRGSVPRKEGRRRGLRLEFFQTAVARRDKQTAHSAVPARHVRRAAETVPRARDVLLRVARVELLGD